jgi:hypothetical protein
MYAQLWDSPAWQGLTKPAQNLLFALATEVRYNRAKSRKPKTYLNNGDVGFPHSLFINKYKASKGTYLKARNQLIERGLIRLTHPGGTTRGDYAKYEVLIFSEMSQLEKRWLLFPEQNWADEIPSHKEMNVGKKTRFKKRKPPLSTVPFKAS